MTTEQPQAPAAPPDPPPRDVSVRALLRVLGYDPDTHGVWSVHHPVRGIRVVDAANEPIKFFAEKALKKLGQSPAFLEQFDLAVAEEELRLRQVEEAGRDCIHGSRTCDLCCWLDGYPEELLRSGR